MKNIKNYIIIISVILIILVGYFINNIGKDNKTNKMEEEKNDIQDYLEKDKSIVIDINGKEYTLYFDEYYDYNMLKSILPIELEMKDLNNNEKYVYLDNNIAISNNYSGAIKKGDVMVYQKNCLVIFYKNFNTSYSYTKIGHINDLPDFDDDSIKLIIKDFE